MLKIKFFIVLMVCGVTLTYGQTDPHFSHYMYNGLYLNPAAAGIGTQNESVTEFLGIYRNQWLNFPGAPVTQVVSVNTPIEKIHGGVGLLMTNDAVGPFNQFTLHLSYSFHLALGSGILGIGPSLGLYNNALDGSLLDPISGKGIDPMLPVNQVSENGFDMGAGIWYRTLKFYTGASMKHLVGPSFTLGTDTDTTAGPLLDYKIAPHMYFTFGYNLDLTREITLVPSVIYKYAETGSYEGSVMASYSKKFWFGLSYRQSDALIGLVGFSFLKDNAMRLGYSYDFTTSELKQYSSGSHEILLTYKIPKKVVLPPSKIIIRTPRFRLE